MRISDWSSDVCSSDLGIDRRQPGQVAGVVRERLAHRLAPIAVEQVEEVVDVEADDRLVALEEARQFLLEAHVELVDPRVAVPVALGDAAEARSQVRIALDELVERGALR